jgi:hypothetical protein
MWHRLPSESYRDAPRAALPTDLRRRIEIVNSFANAFVCKNFGSQLGSTAIAHTAGPWFIMVGFPNLYCGTPKRGIWSLLHLIEGIQRFTECMKPIS